MDFFSHRTLSHAHVHPWRGSVGSLGDRVIDTDASFINILAIAFASSLSSIIFMDEVNKAETSWALGFRVVNDVHTFNVAESGEDLVDLAFISVNTQAKNAQAPILSEKNQFHSF